MNKKFREKPPYQYEGDDIDNAYRQHIQQRHYHAKKEPLFCLDFQQMAGKDQELRLDDAANEGIPAKDGHIAAHTLQHNRLHGIDGSDRHAGKEQG